MIQLLGVGLAFAFDYLCAAAAFGLVTYVLLH